MLLLYFLDKLSITTSSNINKIEENLKLFQNTVVLFLVLYATYAFITLDVNNFVSAIRFIQWHSVLDLLFCSHEIMVHHFLIFNITSVYLSSNMFRITTIPETAVILSTEISTIFLTLRNFYPFNKNKTLRMINDYLFIGAFIYTRIYSYSQSLIYNNELYVKANSYFTPLNAKIFTVSVYLLFALNIYWTSIIVKKIVKQIKSYLPTFQECESMIKYMFFSSPIESISIYSPFDKPIYFVDTIGQFFLSITSHEYHYSMQKQSDLNKNVHDDDTLWYYINDVLLIHVRCMLCVFTNINPVKLIEISATNYSYYHEFFTVRYCLLYISFINHISAMYHFVKYVLFLKHSNISFSITETDSDKIFPCHIYQGGAILLDTFIIMYNTNSPDIRNNLFLITVLIFANAKVGPFYQMTHLVFHVLLFFQTMFLSQANAFVNNELYQYQ